MPVYDSAKVLTTRQKDFVVDRVTDKEHAERQRSLLVFVAELFVVGFHSVRVQIADVGRVAVPRV